MQTTEELLAQLEAEAQSETPVCIIDPETRTITVPPEYQILGVENDKRVERLYFQCPKIVGDNQDLSQDYQLFVNYQNANGDPDAYKIEDMQVKGDNITFSWLLEENVTKYRGNIQFAFGAIIPGDEVEYPDKNRWNTTINTDCTCLIGLKCTQQVAESNPDALAQIWAAIDALKAGGGGGTGGTTNYENLSNKPQLNGVTLEGNKTLDQVGVLAKNQGSSNSGKYLSVGSDGDVVPTDAPSGGSVDSEQIKQAVNGYLEENPPSGMTEEQEQQLNQNTTDVSDLKSALPQKVDREGIFGSNKLNVKYGDTQSGYKIDGQKVGWSNIYCTNMIDCSNIYKIHCVKVGGVNSSSVFPAVVFFDELNLVISYVNADVQLNEMYYTFSGTIIVPENAKYVAFNKVKGDAFESQNEIYIVQKKISEEINEINKLTDYTNIKTIKVETSKKLIDAITCNAKVEISGDPCEIWIYGKNRLPKLPEQSIESNGVTVSVNKDGEIVLNGTCTATSVGGFLNFSDNIRLEKNKYYLYFEKKDDGINSTFQIGNLVAYSTFSKRYVETTVEVNQNNIYVSLNNIEQNHVFQDYKILFEVSTEEIPDRAYISNYPQIITESSVVHIEKGSEIVVFSDGESNVNISYAYEGDEYLKRNGAGNVDKTGVNPEWWGWNLSDGDAFFRYNCDPTKWPQYKEIDSPTLIRGMLVVGKNKKYIGGNSYMNQYPTRYGFHIFEGVGRESDNHRLTMLGGHMPNTAAIFYFETPYDGSDENMSDDVYGWLQLGSDIVYTGAMFRPEATRFYVPITFSRMTNEIELSKEKVKVGNKTSEVKTTYEEDTEFKNNATEEDMYPVGTVYYNENLNKLRVHTPSGWKSLAFED